MRAVHIAIRPSRRLRWMRWFMLFWLMILLVQQLGWLWGGLSAGLMPLLLPAPKTPHALQINPQGQFAIAYRPDDWQNIEFQHGLIFANMIFYRYHSKNGGQTVILWRDQTDDASWRHLQSRMRWRRNQKAT